MRGWQACVFKVDKAASKERAWMAYAAHRQQQCLTERVPCTAIRASMTRQCGDAEEQGAAEHVQRARNLQSSRQ